MGKVFYITCLNSSFYPVLMCTLKCHHVRGLVESYGAEGVVEGVRLLLQVPSQDLTEWKGGHLLA